MLFVNHYSRALDTLARFASLLQADPTLFGHFPLFPFDIVLLAALLTMDVSTIGRSEPGSLSKTSKVSYLPVSERASPII